MVPEEAVENVNSFLFFSLSFSLYAHPQQSYCMALSIMIKAVKGYHFLLVQRFKERESHHTTPQMIS